MSEKNVPEIRFQGFSGEWETLKLSDIAEFNPKAEIPNNFEYVDLESVVGTQLIGSRKENKKTAPSRAQRVAVQGDVFYQTVRPYQKNNYMFDMPYTNYVFSTGYAQLRPYGDSYCLLSFLQNSKFIKKVLDDCTGTSYPAINSTVLSVINVKYSDDADEQIKIGEFFKNLDDLIAQNQKKYDKLVHMKKACLDKMFPKEGADTPEVRFQGFCGEWERKKITDIAYVFIGLVTTMTKFYCNEGVLLIRNSDIKDNRFEFSESPIYLEETFADANANRKLLIGDVITVHTGDVGTSAVVTKNETGAIGFATINTRANQTIIKPHYLSTYFNSSLHKNYAIKMSTGDGRSNYNLRDFNELIVPVPTLSEQTKIGTFFQTLDNLIALRKTELEKLKNIKKACLDKMFI